MILTDDKYFHLMTQNTSYVIRVLPDRTLNHCYYGKRISNTNLDEHHLFIGHDCTAPVTYENCVTTMDAIPQEYPSFGRGDYRTPAAILENNDGRTVGEFKYTRFKHYSGIAQIEGMPNLDCNVEKVQTLEIILHDTINDVSIYLYYTVFEDSNIIERHTRIKNHGEEDIIIRKVLSASVDFENSDFDMVSLYGRWACERSIERLPLRHGKNVISSTRGTSGHSSSPFVALAQKNADENYGDVYAMTLVYSGNFEIGADVGQFGGTRFFGGINSETFSWCLSSGDEFVTPQALLTYSSNGFGEMSKNFHTACRKHLGVCSKNKKHPIVLNLWEAFYFDVTEEAVIKSVRAVRDIGIDTVILDDGWFGKRENDQTSLGDWFINKEKFPNGFDEIVSECKANGLKFGLWLEPEMISEDSEMYRKHPDWCIRLPYIKPIKSRNQLVLDMSRPDVVDGVYKLISKLIKENSISYIKWDMNRNITDYGSISLEAKQQGEHLHRYILGVYALMDRLTKRYPNIFFEGCAGGGGRFDFGILYYMPQIWTSDNSDAIARLKIQYGTSLVFPPETMSAHISDCPNHQTGRITPLETRANVAQLFSFGYEFDPSTLSQDMRKTILDQVGKHREYENWIYNSDFYRLRSFDKDNKCAWQLVSADKKHSAVLYAVGLIEANSCGEYIRLKGLDPDIKYSIVQLGIEVSGDILMNVGLPIRNCFNDFDSILLDIEEKNIN